MELLGRAGLWGGLVRSGAVDSGGVAAAVTSAVAAAAAALKVALGRALQLGPGALRWMQAWRPAKRRHVSSGGQAVLSR